MSNYFYHMDILHDENEVEEFYPRIPMDMIDGEDEEIDRICVSSSIRGCISSAPWGQERALSFGDNMVFRVYKFNKKDIDEANIISSQELYEKGLVGDALVCDEFWIVNQSIKPCDVFYINITDYKKSMEPIKRYKQLDEFTYKEFNIDDFIASKDFNDYDSIEYSIIDKSELLFGSILKLPIKELSKLGEYELVKDILVDLIKDSYMINDEDELVFAYEDEHDEYLLIDFEGFFTGLWYKKLMKELMNQLENH